MDAFFFTLGLLVLFIVWALNAPVDCDHLPVEDLVERQRQIDAVNHLEVQ